MAPSKSCVQGVLSQCVQVFVAPMQIPDNMHFNCYCGLGERVQNAKCLGGGLK